MSENNINYELLEDNGFLGDLEVDSYQPPPSDKEIARKQKQQERQYKKMMIEQAKEQKQMEKEQKKSKRNRIKWSK